MKLKTLRTRLQAIAPRVVALAANPGATPRLTGRAAVDRRRRWLHLHPLCVECVALGITVPVPIGDQVDHVIPLELGGRDDESNLQTLCTPHHAVKTAREAGERARRRGG